uniref:Uncharacterized protein n=1 Tax=Meloidogyne javanica TaxID=6303 RepID=A0A915M7J3_MELJA
MQCGFAFLEAGAVRNSLLGILGYWAIGWALAYGPNSNNFLDHFFDNNFWGGRGKGRICLKSSILLPYTDTLGMDSKWLDG